MIDTTRLVQDKELKSIQTIRAKSFDFESIKKELLPRYREDGWHVAKESKHSIKIKKTKPLDRQFEDQVWVMLARMNFLQMNRDRNFRLKYSEEVPGKQIDVFAFDGETLIIVECKTSVNKKTSSFGKDILEISQIKQKIAPELKKIFRTKPKVAWIFATKNILVNDNDKARMRENNIIHFNQDEIGYYENLVELLGSAAKYQLFGRLFKDQTIPELANKVPAIKGNMGGHTYYSFSINPDVLLKVGFILHRTDSSTEAFDSYQRMVKKNRIVEIENYINDGGFFPNSVIINFNEARQFDLAKTPEHNSPTQLGVLHLPKKYHSAFIIDGQHRLYGYGNTEWKSKNTIPVVAFESLPAKVQTKIFVDINHKQKSVPKNLLTSLMSEFNWGSPYVDEAFAALKTKLLHNLNNAEDSALKQRIVTGEEKKSHTRCLTLDYLIVSGLNKTNFFGEVQNRKLLKTGYLYCEDYDKTLAKACKFLNLCFLYFESEAGEMWTKGSNEGGFIAMNVGIASLLRVFDDIFDFLSYNQNNDLSRLSADDLYRKTLPFLVPIVGYLNNLDLHQIKTLRGFFGSGAVDKVLREFQSAIHKDFDDFLPEGLAQWEKERTGLYNKPAKDIGDELQILIRDHLFQKLKGEFGEKRWWSEGIPKDIQKSCAVKKIEDGNKERDENYLLTLDYEKIIRENKSFLINFYTEPGKESSGTEKKVAWFAKFNSIRVKFSHPEREKVTEEELNFLKELLAWLKPKLTS